MTEVAVTEALGELLSPSQVNTYMTCPAKWYFRYLLGVSEPATGALALGKAFHGTLARNFRQKMSTGRDMESSELPETFRQEWSLAVSGAVCVTTKTEQGLPRPAKSFFRRTWQKRLLP
jgi:hypothetical protein